MSVLDERVRDLKADEVVLDDKVAKVSIVGIGMRGHPGVAAKLFRAWRTRASTST
jgi:aspartate kinase